MTDDPPKDPPPESPAPEAPAETSPSIEVAPEAFQPLSSEVAPEAFQPPPSSEVASDPFAPASPSEVASDPFAPPPSEAPHAALGPAPTDDSILPAAYTDDALRDAVGAAAPRTRRKRKKDDDGGGPRKPAGKRGVLVGGIVLVTGLVIGAFVVLGHANAQRYAITCATDRVSAERGRSFPPWGTHPLIGPEWRPIALPPNAECKPRETDSRSELEGWYLELVIDRASTTLSSPDLLAPVPTGTANPLDVAADQLNQALLLSRAPERRDQRKEVERLLGDVTYWRASLRLREAAAGLADAARQFEEAAAQRPRHVADAGQWAGFLHRLVDQLQAGPAGVPPVAGPAGVPPVAGPVEPPAERPQAPLGEELPVEPELESEPEPAPAPDAGLPSGGVLL